MSFPFVVPIPDTPQPPPTGGSLSIIARANTTTPYAAGGGGGPSTIGPNPVVSSITLGGQFPNVNMADGGLLITNNGFDTTSTIVGIEYNPTAPSVPGIGGPDFTVIQAGTLNTYPVLDLGLGGDGRILLSLNSTMSIVGDSVNISSLNVSSINGAAPGGAIPEDLVVNSVAASTFTASTITLQTFDVPVILTGATTLNAGGSTIVGPLDRTYTIPYYQMLTYRGNPVPASTLFASTIDGTNFAVFGEPNLTFQYAIFGN